jgi:hypothetical protein
MSKASSPIQSFKIGKFLQWQFALGLLGLSLVALGGLFVWFVARGGMVGTVPKFEHLAYVSLQEGNVARQDFQAERDGLGGLDIALKPRTTDISLIFQLYEIDTNKRVPLTVQQATCQQSSEVCRVTFPAIKRSAGKHFAWTVDQIEHSTWNDAARTDLLITLDGRTVNGALEINEHPTNYDAVFIPVYRSARTFRYFLQDSLLHSLTNSQAAKRLSLLTLNSLVVLCLLVLIFQPRRPEEGLATFQAMGTIASLLAALLSIVLVWTVVLKPAPWVSSLQDENAQQIDLHCLTGDVCRQRSLDALNVMHRVQVDFGEQMRLVGYSLENTSLTPGASLRLNLYWHRLRQMETDYSIFVHLIGETSEILTQHDSYPVQGAYPTTAWLRDDEVISDVHELSIPESVTSQSCRLQVGVYYWVDLSRLPVVDSHTGLLPDAVFQLPQTITINAP